MSNTPETVYEHRPQRVHEGLRWNGNEWVMAGDMYDNDDCCRRSGTGSMSIRRD